LTDLKKQVDEDKQSMRVRKQELKEVITELTHRLKDLKEE